MNNVSEEDEFISQNPKIFKKFKPLKLIGKGTFSTVYLAENISNSQQVAVKVEKRINDSTDLLESEAFLLYKLRGFGIPEVISFGRLKNYNILIEPLLGISLLDLYIKKNKKIDMKDICLIAIQLIDRIEWVHSKEIIYRDVKPENFLFGKINPEILYMIDFGLCRKYININTGKHITPKNIGKFTGTSRYASVYAMAGNEQSRRDDIESIGYLLVFLMKTRLPWQGIQGNSHKECYQKLYLMKKYMPIEKLCNGLPKEMIEYLKIAKNLRFEQEPNYNYLKHLFKNILTKLCPSPSNYKFSWLIKEIYCSTKKNDTKIVKKKLSPNRFSNTNETNNEKNNEKRKGKSPMSQEVGVSYNFFRNLKNLNIGKSTNNINLTSQKEKTNKNNNILIEFNNTNFNLNNKNLVNTIITNYNNTVNSCTLRESRKNNMTTKKGGKLLSFGEKVKISPEKNSSKIFPNKKRENIINEVLAKRKLQLPSDLKKNRKNTFDSKIKHILNSNIVKKKNSYNLEQNRYNNYSSTRNLINEKKNSKLNSINKKNNNTIDTTNKKESSNIYDYSTKRSKKNNSEQHTFDSKNDSIKKNYYKNPISLKNNYYTINSTTSQEKSPKNYNPFKIVNNNSSTGKNNKEKFNPLFVHEKNKLNSQIFSYDRNRKLRTQNSLRYNQEILTRQRNIYNLNINNPTINININNKNNNYSPKIVQSHSLSKSKSKRTSNIKIPSLNKKLNHKGICINITNLTKTKSKINKENKIPQKRNPICTSHNYYYNYSSLNTNSKNNKSLKFSSGTIDYSNKSKKNSLNTISSYVQRFKKEKQIPSIKYTIKKKINNIIKGSKSVYNSLEFGLSEEEEYIRKTYDKNDVNGKNQKNINLVSNDLSKYSFITKNNSKTFMMNIDEEKNDKNNKNNIKSLMWKVNKTKDVNYNEGANDGKGVRINNYMVNRKKKHKKK